jgi:protein-tyrosine phosphatase
MTSATRLPVSGTFNFRSVEGYPAAAGVVLSGKLFRSDGLHQLGDQGRQDLQQLGIRLIIDLRDDFEADAMPDDVAELDVEVVRFPVFEGSAASQGTVGLSLTDLYARIVTQHAQVVVDALRDIARSGSDPVLVHCTAGKDRTGVVIALALLAVGVQRDDVIADYAESQVNLDGEWLDGMVAFIRSHGVDETPELRVLLGGSPPEALAATIDLIESTHGSVQQYLRDSGMGDHDLTLLREALVYSIR